MSKNIECPSGLAIEVRGLTGREGKILTDKQAAKNGTTMDKILESCLVSIIDPGLCYKTDAEGKFPLENLILGDRFYALLQIRILTYGPQYEFQIKCEDCDAKTNVTVDLNDLPVRKLAPEDRNTFLNGNRFEATIPSSGKKCYFRIPTSADEKRAIKALKGESQEVVTALNLRVSEVEGVDPFQKKRYLEDLPMADFTNLFAQFDEHDCGVTTEVTVICNHCESEQDIRLPFDRQFWMPKTRKS